MTTPSGSAVEPGGRGDARAASGARVADFLAPTLAPLLIVTGRS